MIKNIKSWRRHICFLESYDTPVMRDFFEHTDEVLFKSTHTIIKATFGDTTTVAVVEVAGKKYVVKRYNLKGFWHRLKRRFWPSRAVTSWHNALKMQHLGIPSVKPVALIEKRVGPIRDVAYFISEFIDGELGFDYFAPDSKNATQWPRTITAIHALIDRLKIQGIVHDDFSVWNLIIHNHMPVIADLDHMRFRAPNSPKFVREHTRDLAHFHRLLAFNPEVQQQFVFD